MNVIERSARHAIPNIADFCFVHVIHGSTIPCVAAVHVSRGKQTRLRALMRRFKIRRNDLASSVAQVIRTQRPLLLPRVYEEPQDRVRKSDASQMQRQLAPRSVLVVPIMSGPAVVGALSLCYSESGRSHAERHLGPARRLALRISRALQEPVGRRRATPKH
jgi:transcriptional regulator with GAF, ATPase, and Fis domain